MDNVFIYQSVELPDFARSPKGTIGVFFCEWDKLKAAQNRITGKFKHSSLKVKGTCSIKSFNSLDPDSGQGFKVLMVEVVEPIAARKQRGRPLGVKNKVKKVNPNVGITVTPVSHADAVAIVSPSPEHSVTPLPITVADGDGQKQIAYDCSKWGDLR
jgi:hypothetical protein